METLDIGDDENSIGKLEKNPRQNIRHILISFSCLPLHTQLQIHRNSFCPRMDVMMTLMKLMIALNQTIMVSEKLPSKLHFNNINLLYVVYFLDVVAYRVLEFSDCVDPQKSLLNNGTTGTLDISAGGQQYFVISSDSNLANAGGTVYVNASNGAILTASSTTILPPPPPSSHPPNKLASAGILIAPKPIGLDASSPPTTTTGRQQAPLMKRRDDRRRTTHNEVERRRRDKINTGIMQLGSIIPADGVPVASDCSTIMDRPNVANAVGQSKSGILTKACEYIEALHNEVNK